MPLAIFDLDNTLIAGDSDYSWGEFLVAQGKVDPEYYSRMNAQFFRDYEAGTLDMRDYLAFALEPLARLQPEELQLLHKEFMATVIAPMWLPAAERLLAQHRNRGDYLLVITSTNRFIVEPICQKLGVDDLIATEPELVDGRYTGAVSGVPAFREGKVERLNQWLAETGRDLGNSSFYSDSINDLPLLERVETPIAVDADDALAAEARRRGWRQISLR